MVKYHYILKTIDNYLNKCHRTGPKASSGLLQRMPPPKQSTVKITDQELKDIAKSISKKYGLEVSVNGLGEEEAYAVNRQHVLDKKRTYTDVKFRFWDDESKTLIDLSDMVEHQEMMDFTNSGKAKYDLDDFFGYYTQIPPTLRESVGLIKFRPQDEGCNCCLHNMYINVLGGKSYEVDSGIHITSQAFAQDKGNTFNFQRILYHEVGHCFDKDKIIASSEEYYNAMGKNDEKFASDYGRSYYFTGRDVFDDISDAHKVPLREDVAETISMVCFENIDDKINANIFNERVEEHTEFKNNHKHTYDLVKDIIDGKIDMRDLHEY